MKVANISNISMTSDRYDKANRVRKRVDSEVRNSSLGDLADTCILVGALGACI